MVSMKSTHSDQDSDYSTQSTTDIVIPLRHYHAYLLRVWREDELTPWRVQLENPHTHEVLGFPTLEKLLIFLDEKFPAGEGVKKMIGQ